MYLFKLSISVLWFHAKLGKFSSWPLLWSRQRSGLCALPSWWSDPRTHKHDRQWPTTSLSCSSWSLCFCTRASSRSRHGDIACFLDDDCFVRHAHKERPTHQYCQYNTSSQSSIFAFLPGFRLKPPSLWREKHCLFLPILQCKLPALHPQSMEGGCEGSWCIANRVPAKSERVRTAMVAATKPASFYS